MHPRENPGYARACDKGLIVAAWKLHSE